jgi:DNA-binding LacI/PurR family transcriptional regulator
MASTNRRITAREVAEEAGVSKTTVSYVLNNTSHQSIPQHTRQKVLQAVAALGYSPSPVARALRTGRDDTVLLLLPNWPLSGPLSAVVENLLDELDAHGLSLKTRREGNISVSSNEWAQTTPQAVIALHELAPDVEAMLASKGVFVIHALLATAAESSHTVIFPQRLVGKLQVEHLASTGRRRIGYAAPNDPRHTEFASLRIAGSRVAALDLGLAEPLVEHIDPSREDAARLLRTWASLPQPVDGIAAYNDLFAAALLTAARDLEIPVPDGIAIIGVDNEPLSEFTLPPLTTIDQHAEAGAAALASLVVAGLAGTPLAAPPKSIQILSLVVRESA